MYHSLCRGRGNNGGDKMYKWIWENEQIKEFLETISKDRDDMPMDFIGEVRAGNICFDMVEREAEGKYYLWADLYVGGIDSGYGLNNYPYDFIDDIDYIWETEALKELSVEKFKEQVEKKLTELINNSDSEYHLTDKANEQLNVW